MTTSPTLLTAAEVGGSDDVHECAHPVKHHRDELHRHDDDEEAEKEEADRLDADEAAAGEARQTDDEATCAFLNLQQAGDVDVVNFA